MEYEIGSEGVEMIEDIRILLVKIIKIRSNRFVDAQPLFSPNGVELPPLRNIPVGLLGDKTDHFDWNVKVGDIMPYFVLTFDISSYASQGSLEVMDSNRRNNLNNGFILPFTIPNMKETLQFPSDIRIVGNRLEKGNIEQTGNKKQMGNMDLTGNNTITGDTRQNGNISSSGTVSGKEDVVAAGKSMKNHKHTNVTPGTDNTGGVA